MKLFLSLYHCIWHFSCLFLSHSIWWTFIWFPFWRFKRLKGRVRRGAETWQARRWQAWQYRENPQLSFVELFVTPEPSALCRSMLTHPSLFTATQACFRNLYTCSAHDWKPLEAHKQSHARKKNTKRETCASLAQGWGWFARAMPIDIKRQLPPRVVRVLLVLFYIQILFEVYRYTIAMHVPYTGTCTRVQSIPINCDILEMDRNHEPYQSWWRVGQSEHQERQRHRYLISVLATSRNVAQPAIKVPCVFFKLKDLKAPTS